MSCSTTQSHGVFLHLLQFKPMTSLIVILSITLISSSLPQPWFMWLYIEYKDQITVAVFQLQLHIAALYHSRQNERKNMHIPFLPVSRLLCAISSTPQSQCNHYNVTLHSYGDRTSYRTCDSCICTGTALNLWHLKCKEIKVEAQ